MQIESLLVCSGKAKGVRCDVFFVRLINLYIPSITIHCPPVVYGGLFFRGTIFTSAVPFRLPQTFQFNLGCTTVHLLQTHVKWMGFPGLAEIPPRKGGTYEGPTQSGRTVTSASPRPLPAQGDVYITTPSSEWSAWSSESSLLC